MDERKELHKKLKDAGLKFRGFPSLENLKKMERELLSGNAPKEDVTDAPEAPKQPVDERKDSDPTPESLGVFRGQNLVRIYSKELHGKDYEKLASEYAKARDLTVLPYSAPLPKVEEEIVEEEAVILTQDGEHRRTYSKSVHGDRYLDIAKKYVNERRSEGKHYQIRDIGFGPFRD